MIHVENFAERLFVDLKNRKIKIEAPVYVLDGAKIGMFPNSDQLNIFGKNGKYIGGKKLSYNNEFNLTFTEAYSKVLEEIISCFGPEIKFYALFIPKNMEAKLIEYETITIRYLKDYIPQHDEIVERWDMMVGSA